MRLVDQTVTIDAGMEWQREIAGLQPGDTLFIRADGDAPFYLDVLTTSELAKRRSMLDDGTTSFARIWPRLHYPRSPISVRSAENHVVVVARRFVDGSLDVDLELDVTGQNIPYSTAASQEGASRVALYGQELTLPLNARYLAAIAKPFLVFVALPIAAVAVISANIFAAEALGVNAIPELLAGDGTLVLSIATFAAVAFQRSSRHLESARHRRLRSGNA